jgi:crotonobetainyl-CoA:carnitine CoA-transferase CaiB-like acyl-CoA transferase
MLPLEGIRILDFSTLLPGPLASLILAEAGAEVIKVERPGGEDMRHYAPMIDGTSASFAMLNRGKRAIEIDLRAPGAAAQMLDLAPTVDIVLEQFRPGVMARLGLGAEQWHAANPRIIYCAITGYGQSGPLAATAGHDLNYQARSGLLSLCSGVDAMPGMPPLLAGDIGGGTYPAVVNILLALRRRDRTGEGCFIDVAMAENLFTFLFWGLASGNATGQWPRTGRELFTGGSPRYRVYATADARHLAVAPLEDKFWAIFCDAIALPADYRDDANDPEATAGAVARILASRPAAHWEELFAKADCCVAVVRSLEEAVRDLHFRARSVFGREVAIPEHVLPALPVPVIAALRTVRRCVPAPSRDTDPLKQPSPAKEEKPWTLPP